MSEGTQPKICLQCELPLIELDLRGIPDADRMRLLHLGAVGKGRGVVLARVEDLAVHPCERTPTLIKKATTGLSTRLLTRTCDVFFSGNVAVLLLRPAEP